MPQIFSHIRRRTWLLPAQTPCKHPYPVISELPFPGLHLRIGSDGSPTLLAPVGDGTRGCAEQVRAWQPHRLESCSVPRGHL